MKQTAVNGRYKVVLPDWLAVSDIWGAWEVERFESMQANLKLGDTLFDIGSEDGSISAIYATFVGGENMCLFEPEPSAWPNIRATWKANMLATPKSCWVGLLDQTSQVARALDHDPETRDGWPGCAWSDELIDRHIYRYLFEEKHIDTTRRIALDDWVEQTGVTPTAITMDTEGAELLILKGSQKVIRDHKPLVWVSVHPDLAHRDFDYSHLEVYALMEDLGYRNVRLGVDHEVHEFFWDPEKHDPVLPS